MPGAVIDGRPGELRAAVRDDDGTLRDLFLARAEVPNPVGDRFLGRVTAWHPGLGVAFVELGLARPGILPLKRGQPRPREGETVRVAVIRAPSADKGAKLARVSDSDAAASPGGQAAPARLSTAPRLGTFLRRHTLDSVTLAGAEAEAALRAEAPELHADAVRRPESADAFAEAGLDAALDALLAPAVDLPGGGRLWVEPVRTLTAIDLDSGADGGAEGGAEGGAGRSAAGANHAAVPEIARQIRLRGLSGLIVVDFLDPGTRAERSAVAAALRTALDADPEISEVSAMRPSGLVEIARQRLRPALHELLATPCGHAGSGWAKTPATVAREALRAVEAAANASPAARWRLSAAPSVLAALGGPVAPARAALERRLGGALILEEAQAATAPESYDVTPAG